MKRDLPVFQQVLGEQWESLGDVVKRHYFLTPYSTDEICVSGVMTEIYHSSLAKVLIPIGWLFGAIVPFRGKNVPVDVHYNAQTTDPNIYWDRVFKFPNGRVFHFCSFMKHVRDNLVIEFVRFGVGMKLRVTAEGGALVFRDEGYLWRIGALCFPIPARLLFGSSYVEERPVDSAHFSMEMRVVHPLFGRLFSYRGVFTLPPET